MLRLSYFLFCILLLSVFHVKAQEIYNDCSRALELCPNKTYSVNNIGANSTVCNNCEDDFNFCFPGKNTVWFKFTTNKTGGVVSADFSNINFENQPGQGTGLQAMIIQATIPCISSSYSLISDCIADTSTNFNLVTDSLPANTTYYIVVNGTQGSSSRAEASFNISIDGEGVKRTPEFSIWTKSPYMCEGNTLIITAHTKFCDDISVFNWYVNGDLKTTTMDSMFIYEDWENNDVVYAEVSCFNQCRDTLTSGSITFNKLSFLVDAGPDITIKRGETAKLGGKTTGNNIIWSPNVNMNNPTVIQPIVMPQETTVYYLTVDNDTCSITDFMTVYVLDDLEIPTAFSPNGDGVNDTWDILGIEDYPNCNVRVYTRWGQLVFQTTGYSKGSRWDGTSKNGRELTEGAYYYVIDLRAKPALATLKGIVSIIR